MTTNDRNRVWAVYVWFATGTELVRVTKPYQTMSYKDAKKDAGQYVGGDAKAIRIVDITTNSFEEIDPRA